MSQLIQVLEQDVSPWPVATLGDGLLENVQPGFACGNHNSGGEGIVHVRPYNVTTDGRMDFSTLKFIPISEVTKPERLLSQGDVVFNNTNSPELVGKTAFYADSEERAFSNHMTRIRVNQDKLRPEYLALALHQLWREGYFADKCNNHVSQASISRTVLLETEIALPPLSEQDRLVEALTATEEAVDRARNRLATIPTLLKKFRQSVLASACAGQLTADWREENRQYSSNGLILDLKSKWSSSRERQLAAAITQDVTELPGLPDTWEYLECRKLTDPSRSLTYGVIKLGEQDDDGVPCLRSSDVRRLHINESKVKKISRKIEEGFKRTSLLGGEVVVTVRGTLGGVAVVPLHMRGFNVSREVAVIPIADPINPSFVAFAIASEPQSKWLGEVAKGVAYTGINIEDLCRLPIPVPPIEEQAEIVRRVEALFSLADSIESRLTEATAQVERTTQAILAKAIRGDLTGGSDVL
ncbi:MAG TPA: restriction endonuclease subunit S [Fimbriimonadaceae bacterium]|nr:restriction endonuclease subunit S [Fimbriimonadaceae bacterium]HRE93196.1 restriction endonuclease subunit S [Fimbriimonadaceae bacterium]